MSEAQVLERAAGLRPWFQPSIASALPRSGCLEMADAGHGTQFWGAALFALFTVLHSSTPASGTLSHPGVAAEASPDNAKKAGFAAIATTPADSQAMVVELKAKGLPIAALADALDVERKTVYSWLDDGVPPNAANYERLRMVHQLLSGEQDGSLRFFHRLWDRTTPGGVSLKGALTASALDTAAVRLALDALRPSVLRVMEADAQRKASAAAKAPASSLTLGLIAVS